MGTTKVAPSVLDDEETTDRTGGDGRINARGVDAVTKAKKMNPSDEEAAVNFFLDDDNDVEETFGLTVPRVKIRFVFRPVKEHELKLLQRRAATGNRLPNGNREVDMMKFYRLVLIETMLTPNLRDDAIISKFGRPEDALGAKLQPGEIENLATKALIKSGFHDDSVIEDEDAVAESTLAKN